jgi:hypothetical protein
MNWILPETVWLLFCAHGGLVSLSFVMSMIEFLQTGRVYILDMYNPGIYPFVSCLL